MLLTYIIVALLPCILGFPRKIPIGGLFDGDEMIQKAFELSVKAVNRRVATSKDIADVQLTAKSERVVTNSFRVAREACELLGMGVSGIFGPQDKVSAGYVQSMCDAVDIPYIAARWDAEQIRGNVVNLYPHPDALSKVFHDLVEEYQWDVYALLYDNTEALIRMNRLLQLHYVKEYEVNLYYLGNGPNFRDVIQKVKSAGILNIVIDCSYEILPTVLEQALQVGVMSHKHQLIIASLDLQTIDLEPYQYSGVNITGLRLIDPENPTVQEIFNSRSLNWNLTDPSQLRVEAALAYDAVQLFARGFMRLSESVRGDLRPLYCNSSQTWEHGMSFSNLMRAEEMKGLTGLIKFDTEGFRSDFHLDIMNLAIGGLRKIGSWSAATGVKWDIKYGRPGAPAKSLSDKHFIVLISLTDPYGMLKESTQIMTGNERYEGFAVDIIDEMSKMLGFNYTFEVQADNVYGDYKEGFGWTGMIRKIMDDRAHLAITDLTITAERESAVDFTTPFMNLGISVLYRKPTKLPPSWLSFLLPFSKDIWIHLTGAYIIVTILLYFIGRLCPYEWTNPYPCIKEPEVLETPFTTSDTPFFVVGSLLKAPTGFAPAGYSTRAIATAWWFFCLIMTSTYTANLAAALSTKATFWPFRSAEELAYQNTIKYGAKSGGSTLAFFQKSKHPPYMKMYQTMMKDESEVMTSSNKAGRIKVQQENYAFFMESTSIEYVQQRHCNVTQVGSHLDSKGYGIAMKKYAPYRDDLNGAILRLKENGKLNELQVKWWKQKRGGDKCQVTGQVKAEALNFEDVGGVFLILICGIMLSWLYTTWSLVWHVRAVAAATNVPFREEIINEIKFLIRCEGKKTVRGRKRAAE